MTSCLRAGPVHRPHARSTVVTRALFDNDPFSGLRTIQGDVNAIQQRAQGETAQVRPSDHRYG